MASTRYAALAGRSSKKTRPAALPLGEAGDKRRVRFRLTPLLASFGVFWWPKFGIALELSAWICTFMDLYLHSTKTGAARRSEGGIDAFAKC